jgi:plastocyanin
MDRCGVSEERSAKHGRLGRIAARVGIVLIVFGNVAAVGDMVSDSDPETATGGSGSEASVGLRDFNYSPKLVQMPSRSSVVLVLSDQSLHAHTFTSDALGVDITLQPGSERRVTIPGRTTGRFWFYCRYHQSIGMKGWVQFGADEQGDTSASGG